MTDYRFLMMHDERLFPTVDSKVSDRNRGISYYSSFIGTLKKIHVGFT